jgi:hypothetical protein
MDEKTHQDEPDNRRNATRGKTSTTAPTRRMLNLRRRSGNCEAAVLPFRAKRPDG